MGAGWGVKEMMKDHYFAEQRGPSCPASNPCEQRPLEEWRPQFWCGEAPVAALAGVVREGLSTRGPDR